jgi:hypothetical protein
MHKEDILRRETKFWSTAKIELLKQELLQTLHPVVVVFEQ